MPNFGSRNSDRGRPIFGSRAHHCKCQVIQCGNVRKDYSPPGPEEFVNLQGHIVQSSNWFGISSVQFSSLVTSLESSSSSFRGFGSSAPVQFAEFSPFSSVHELFRPWLGLTWLARLGSGSVQSIESPIVWEEQRSGSRSPPAEIPARWPGVCCRCGGIARFAGCVCLLVRAVGVGVTQIQFKTVLKEFISIRLPDRARCLLVQFSSRTLGPSGSLLYLFFMSMSSGHAAHCYNSPSDPGK